VTILTEKDFALFLKRVDGFRSLRPHWPEAKCVYHAINSIAPDIVALHRAPLRAITIESVREYVEESPDKRIMRTRSVGYVPPEPAPDKPLKIKFKRKKKPTFKPYIRMRLE
jgi:hypothetical protein